MAQEIKMPELGSGIEGGTLLNWLKNVGDTINQGDPLAEVETDKTSVEVPSPVGGTILQLLGSLGDMINVGAVIGYVGAAGEAVPGGAAPAAQPAQVAAPAAASAETRPPQAAPAEEKTPPPSYGAAPKDQPPGTSSPLTDDAQGETEGNGHYPGGVKASPVARRMAQEKGIDLRLIKGSGPGGRIVREDVETYTPAPAQPAPAPQPAAPAAPAIGGTTYGAVPQPSDDIEIIDTSKIRGRIAARMVQSKQLTPHFYVTSEIDVEAMLALRQQINAALPEDQKITVNDLVVKATALTLVQFPNLNTHFYGDKLVRYKRIHIGIAVAQPGGGLINVVAKDADKVSLGALAASNKAMIARAREGKVKPDDVQGSTFTVSNLGAYDVEHFLAIINPPEAGILAIGSAKKVPVVKPDGSLGIGNRMKVTISVDHRVSDGAEGAQFMQAFKTLIENPMRLLV